MYPKVPPIMRRIESRMLMIRWLVRFKTNPVYRMDIRPVFHGGKRFYPSLLGARAFL
jgi:hypothetical protein